MTSVPYALVRATFGGADVCAPVVVIGRTVLFHDPGSCLVCLERESLNAGRFGQLEDGKPEDRQRG